MLLAGRDGRAAGAVTIRVVPMYEFRCEACGERFEALVELGTETTACRACGSAETKRVLSTQAASMRLIKPRGEARKQEGRNAQLRQRTKAEFKQSRERARARSRKPGL
jgi:putative FmdB family regulatory protein